MKKTRICLLWLALSVVPSFGQIIVEVTLPQDHYLPGEALPAAVRVINRSGQALKLGQDASWLTFTVQSRDNQVVRKLGEPPVEGEFSLESSKRATKRVDLAPWFALTQPGRYSVTASVHIKEWDKDITSKPVSFDVVRGSKMWEQEFGVPVKEGSTNPAPEVRKFILQQTSHARGENHLYLRVTDTAGTKVIRVTLIGTLLSFSRPEHQVDRESKLHVLFASGPQSYSYSVFNPDGALVTREIYDYVGSRPRLQVDDEGAIYVIGGVRRPPLVEESDSGAGPSSDAQKPQS